MTQKLTWIVFAAIVGTLACATALRATPGSGLTGTTVGPVRFDEIDVHTVPHPANVWQAMVRTHGLSDVYVQSNVFAAGGGHSGWHTHPGPSLILVTAGTITAYEGDDPSCTPHVYPQGVGFVDPGGDHVHLLRNEDPNVEARTVAVQLIPADAPRRIDEPAPGNCPF